MVRGTVQGNSMSPLWFNIGQDIVLKQFMEECSDIRLLSYHDDHYILGSVTNVLTAFKVLKDKLDSIGLKVNNSKSNIFSFGSIDQTFHGEIKELQLKFIPAKERILVAGSPIGCKTFMENFMDKQVEQIKSKLLQLSQHFRFPKVIFGSRKCFIRWQDYVYHRVSFIS